MGYTLKPRKKGETLDLGAFVWPEMLATGMGFIIGWARIPDQPFSFSYAVDADARDTAPTYNDGFRVTAKEATAMAEFAQGWITVQLGAPYKEAGAAVPEDSPLFKAMSRFAKWARTSGGFRIW